MVDTYFVRFCEYERYDPMIDTEVVQFMAITPKGTFHCETPLLGTASTLRINREAFKTYVLSAMSLHQPPCEVHVG